MSNYQPRYSAFLKMGGGTIADFKRFIAKMKKLYLSYDYQENPNEITDHVLFTAFIDGTVDAWIQFYNEDENGNSYAIKHFFMEN